MIPQGRALLWLCTFEIFLSNVGLRRNTSMRKVSIIVSSKYVLFPGGRIMPRPQTRSAFGEQEEWSVEPTLSS